MVIRIVETRDQMIDRLAAKARAEGIRLYCDSRDGRHYASSASNPGHLHYLTAVSCTCAGFASHGRCKHHAALLTAFGWAGTHAEPQPILCETCRGVGTHPGTISTGRSWAYVNVVCEECHGTGQAGPLTAPAA
jgi:hypothetical protein